MTIVDEHMAEKKAREFAENLEENEKRLQILKDYLIKNRKT
jgi:hypothetical protein